MNQENIRFLREDYLHLLVPVFIPLIFIFGIPLLIRNYIIKKIVDKEFPKDKKLQ